jgi:hypothetical protein
MSIQNSMESLHLLKYIECSCFYVQDSKQTGKLITWESKNYKHKKQEESDHVRCHPAQGHLQWS